MKSRKSNFCSPTSPQDYLSSEFLQPPPPPHLRILLQNLTEISIPRWQRCSGLLWTRVAHLFLCTSLCSTQQVVCQIFSSGQFYFLNCYLRLRFVTLEEYNFLCRHTPAKISQMFLCCLIFFLRFSKILYFRYHNICAISLNLIISNQNQDISLCRAGSDNFELYLTKKQNKTF